MNEVVQATNRECAESLKRFVATHGKDTAFFVGSGLSIPAYPSWRQLPTKMAAYYETHGAPIEPSRLPSAADIVSATPSDLQEMFQHFCSSNPKLFVDFIESTFNEPPQSHREAICTILKQRPSLIATLNFDVAIETAAQMLGTEIEPRYFPAFQFIQPPGSGTVLFQLHGRFHEDLRNDPNRIILHTLGQPPPRLIPPAQAPCPEMPVTMRGQPLKLASPA